jgi:hypothetical protein
MAMSINLEGPVIVVPAYLSYWSNEAIMGETQANLICAHASHEVMCQVIYLLATNCAAPELNAAGPLVKYIHMYASVKGTVSLKVMSYSALQGWWWKATDYASLLWLHALVFLLAASPYLVAR